ncbi:hypothetical protein [Arsenicicoccus dermatophilus]|uniref:hypothetical protein n=1 Tax=Arsenicicoccus dermatophilus TaxID=1076331 RepID=UPI001F4CB342|nr:hypothetical protein [Arsenicicoccus dermatophilus]MCH8612875.1 hypothetical protein [Arsenicicoccus dermatophilus]
MAKDNTGLSLGYRIMWQLRYLGVSVFGPAQLDPDNDPKDNLIRERRRKVAAAHAAAGTTPKG